MKPVITVFCESWLNETVLDEEITIPNYEIYRCDRVDGRRGGGVCVYINENYKSAPISSHLRVPDFLECIWTHLPRNNILLLSIYIPPNLTASQTREATNYITLTADTFLIQYQDSKLIIAGDLNRFPTCELQNNLGLVPVVTSPTRGDRILDQILLDENILKTSVDESANNYDKRFEVMICPRIGNSDHETVFIKPLIKLPEESSWIKVYDLRESNMNGFRASIKSFPWHELYRRNASIDEKCDTFYQAIEKAKESIPYDVVKMKPTDKPWITPTLKCLINKRFQAYRRKDFKLYQHYKDKVKKSIEKAKQLWVTKKCQAPYGLWSVVNNIMNKNVKTSLRTVTDSYPSLVEAANAINSEFKKHYTDSPDWFNIVQNLKQVHADWIVNFSVDDVLKLLLKVNPRKACGSDDLHPRILKEAAHELAEPITHLFAISIATEELPAKWKIAHVIPIPKRQRPTIHTLRPISLLPVVSKLLEKLVLKSVLSNLISLYGNNQFGFRPATSTLHAHLTIHDFITRIMDCDQTAGVVLTTYDMSKAFDTIKHEALFRSLTDSDLPIGFLKWCANFLQKRRQRVRISQTLSSTTEEVTSGVPQGSVIAPYLFAAHMGKLNANTDDFLTVKYADDVITVVPFTQKCDVSDIISSRIREMTTWCSSNGLILNIEKTKSMLIRKSTIPLVFTPAPELTATVELKLLGVIYQ
jgi:hypothetical protein